MSSKTFRAPLAVLGVLILILGALFSAGLPARADDGGSGSVGGGDLPEAGGLGISQRWYDDPQAGPSGAAFPQGTGQASIDYFLNKVGMLSGSDMAGRITAACNEALAEANSRGTPPSRVVGIVWAWANNSPILGSGAARGNQHFRAALDRWRDGGYQGFYGQARQMYEFGGVRQTAYQYSYSLGMSEVANGNGETEASLTAAVCVALNSNEPPTRDPAYSLSIATEAKGDPAAGGAQAVYDQIAATHTPAGDDWNERGLNATVILNYRPTTTCWGGLDQVEV